MKKLLSFLAVIMLITLTAPVVLVAQTEAELQKQYTTASTDADQLLVLEQLTSIASKKGSETFLTKVLNDAESSKVRGMAAKILGVLKTGRVVLETAFSTDDKYVRLASLEALYKIADPKSTAYFIEGINDKKVPELKYWGLAGLSLVGTKVHLAYFIDALQSKEPETVLVAVRAIGNLKDPIQWRHLKAFAEGTDPALIKACVEAAGKMTPDLALPFLENRMADPNQEIASAAISAIGKYAGFNSIATLVTFKMNNPTSPNLTAVIAALKEKKAAASYAVLKSNLNLRKEANDRADVVKLLENATVVEILAKGKRKYTIVDSKGQEVEDFWYEVKLDKLKGFLFGAYITIVETTK